MSNVRFVISLLFVAALALFDGECAGSMFDPFDPKMGHTDRRRKFWRLAITRVQHSYSSACERTPTAKEAEAQRQVGSGNEPRSVQVRRSP